MASEMIPEPTKTAMQLNDQQQHAINKMVDFIRDGGMAFTLKGFAGTGKSTAIMFLLERMKSEGMPHAVFFTAPTHKAVKVLKNMAEANAIGDITFATIQSLLGLKVVTHEDKQTLEPNRGARSALIGHQAILVVVDECSMVGTELFGHIVSSTRRFPVQYIFMGDPAQ